MHCTDSCRFLVLFWLKIYILRPEFYFSQFKVYTASSGSLKNPQVVWMVTIAFGQGLCTAVLAMYCRMGLCWHFRCDCPILNQDQLWVSHQKNQGSIFLICSKKSKNELVRPKTVFLAILAKKWSFFDNSDI